MFGAKPEPGLRLSRRDPEHPLSTFYPAPFVLEEREWPTVEHYIQAMQYDDEGYQETIRQATTPAEAEKLGQSKKPGKRKDWERVREIYMTRGVYIRCRSHDVIADALLATGEKSIVENSQYDYYWGCGRDGRGDNTYGKVLMAVRDKLRSE